MKYNCYGAESHSLKNGCTNQVDEQYSLCDSCKKEYYGSPAIKKKRRSWTLEEMQQNLKEFGYEARERDRKLKKQDKQLINNIKETLF